MPITVISVLGRVVHIRPLPSDSTTHTVPVSATAKFAPLIATSAVMNLSRRKRRAASARSAGSGDTPSAPGRFARNRSRISARLRWIAGTRMWEALSPES